jgi:hypothetical protein
MNTEEINAAWMTSIVPNRIIKPMRDKNSNDMARV